MKNKNTEKVELKSTVDLGNVVNYIYLGPHIKGLGITTNTLFYGAIPSHVEDYLDKNNLALVKLLIVPTYQMAETQHRMNTSGTAEYIAVQKVKEAND